MIRDIPELHDFDRAPLVVTNPRHDEEWKLLALMALTYLLGWILTARFLFSLGYSIGGPHPDVGSCIFTGIFWPLALLPAVIYWSFR